MEGKPRQHPSSYRDPSGFIFIYQGEIYRQVNKSFQKDFEAFINSSLYNDLLNDKLLIPHTELQENFTGSENWFTTLKPEKIDFISYPYEWSFSMLKDAALLTLQLAEKALAHGMILKDASPYNVQLHKGRMTFIDTLSFEQYKEGEPWIAYRQFCENFIGPLVLMHYLGLPMQQLLLAHPDGIPLQYIKQMLPFRSRFNVHLYLHIHLHASYGSKSSSQQQKTFLSKQKLSNLLQSLKTLVSSFRFDRFENVWGRYYEEASTREGYLEEKASIISPWISSLPDIKSVIDIGGNKGEFSKRLATKQRQVICADGEHYAVEALYNEIKKAGLSNLTPVCIDFTSPSAALGMNNEERTSFLQRASSDLAMALALIHHLAIGKNISFHLIAKMCARLGKLLIIEFVSKDDEKVKLLLQHKKDIYHWYTEEAFLQAFCSLFKLIEKRALSSSPRTLYLMERL
jgi:2-polyprenyl-3-methyl-5-hydroxy-6-metoxy-1,4-benzoquinol methylase